jgi:acetoin utilization deacetylase AcuC-like enzyme
MTGIYHHDLFGKHLEGYGHVEQPARYRVIMDRLRSCAFTDRLEFVEAEAADPEVITGVHEKEYMEGILSLEIDEAMILDWGDTVATPATPNAALHAAGAAVQAARDILEGRFRTAFCPVRPPGHHAESGRAMGFCLFNNIAVAAKWLTGDGGLDRVAIIDWDIHHGNGTERMFMEDPGVLYVSLHQYPHYPGTGHYNMVGTGPGTGFTLNVPLGSGADDAMYREEFTGRIIPALDDFRPEMVLISAGFDAHEDDPLSGARLSTSMYAEMTEMICGVAERHSGGRVLSLLEGGYDLDALADSAEAHVGVLVERDPG